MVLEAGKSKIKALEDLVSGESPLSGPWIPSVSPHDRNDTGVLWGPFHNGSNSIHEGSTLTR